MITAAKHKNALKALQLVLCQARTMALTGGDPAKIAELLDWAELLPEYIADDDDKTADFENALAAIVEKCPLCRNALAAYSHGSLIRRGLSPRLNPA